MEPAWSSTFQQPRTETLQKHTSCVTEKLPVGLSELWKAWPMENLAAKVGEDAPHLKAIRNRCKQVSIGAFFFLWVSFWREISIISCMAEVEAELSFLEQEILEKFRNQASAGIGRHQLS